MASRKQLNDLREAQERRREALAKLTARKPASPAKPAVLDQPVRTAQASRDPEVVPAFASTPQQTPPPAVLARSREALIAIFKDDSVQPSEPSRALVTLADLYLHAAEYRTRHIAMVWPASLKTLTVVHALASVARWRAGDKQGVRGLLYPVKRNAFQRLNHVHFDRVALLRIAQDLVDRPGNTHITRPMRDKDAFYFSLSDDALPQEAGERFNPTIGEMLPHFLATPDTDGWSRCDAQLLALVRAKLSRRSRARALQTNCAVLGNPRTAPDALFALDGRMTDAELRQACRALNRLGPPEVVLVQATRAIRLEAPGWRGRLVRFCRMLDEVFRTASPGVIVVTDDPYAAYSLRERLQEDEGKRRTASRRRESHDLELTGIPSSVGSEGLLAAGSREAPYPAPREFDVHIVDADAARVANKLVRIASAAPGGREAAKPLMEAASFLSRLAALPCGTRHMSDYLAGPDVSGRTRASFDWPGHMGAVLDYERSIGVGEKRPALEQCLKRGSEIFAHYHAATPFAHKLAELVANGAMSTRRGAAAVVFTSALYRRLAERFLGEYNQYPGGGAYETFRDRVHLLPAAQLEERLDELQGAKFIFAGLNEDCLRILLTNDRIPAHTAILLTQRAGQFLRATLRPIVKHLPQFKSYRPRMESILRQLKDLPEDASVLAGGDYVLPAFRVELSSEGTASDGEIDPDAWVIRLDSGTSQYRRDTSDVYIYDPASPQASDAGFRVGQVRTLEPGDRVFVMSAELREMVEQALREAGIPIQSDKTFEMALRSYHEQVQRRLAEHFPQAAMSDKVRAIREAMLTSDPKLERDLPRDQAIRQWIDLGHSPDTPFEQLRPQAPRSESAFKVFAHVLGFSLLEAAYQWQRVIMPVRTSRRIDGRHVSDIYEYMLLQPESAMAHSSIKRQTLAQLFDKARENVATVEYAGPLKEPQS